MPGVRESHVQVTPSDGLFAIGTRHPSRRRRFREVQLATSREAAFGHCLAPYRPRAGLDDDIDAYLDSEPEDGVVAHSGWVSSHIFDGFKLLELHFVRDAYFQRAAATHRFQRITHSHVVHQARIGARLLKVRAADPPIGHELRFLHWDYRVVWNHRTAVAMLEMYDDSHIRGSDWDLHRAAERLGITLT